MLYNKYMAGKELTLEQIQADEELIAIVLPTINS